MTSDAVLNNEQGYWDISIEGGDIANDDFFDTAILYSLFGEKRASSDEVVEPQQRRGWIGNDDFENGSKLWLFQQSRLTRDVLNRIQDEARKSLAWLVGEGYAVSIDDAVASVSGGRVQLEVTIRRSRDKVERRFFELWQNTGKR